MIFAGPAEHRANPPSTWVVRKHGRKWGLFAMTGGQPLDVFETKRSAEHAKTDGIIARLYAKETRWYAGESVDGWMPYQPPQSPQQKGDTAFRISPTPEIHEKDCRSISTDIRLYLSREPATVEEKKAAMAAALRCAADYIENNSSEPWLVSFELMRVHAWRPSYARTVTDDPRSEERWFIEVSFCQPSNQADDIEIIYVAKPTAAPSTQP